VARPRLNREELVTLNARFESASATEVIAWGVARFRPRIACLSSFGADSAVMLHLATQVCPDILVVAINTGFLFDETLAFADLLKKRLNLNLRWYTPPMTAEDFVAEHGAMWKVNPDACCAYNKREPFLRAKLELDAWLTGIRRQQSVTRRQTQIVSLDLEGQVKLCPIASWSSRDVHEYLKKHDLPYHPLRDDGYLSIGCRHCTRRVVPGDDSRSGRWAGFDKTECGLHTFTHGDGI
jgi:phosphoadenosine phosphosulfate reductase